MTKLTVSECPRGARCTPLPNDDHEVSYALKLLNDGRPFVLSWEFEGIHFTADVMLELQVRTRMQAPYGPAEVNLLPAIQFEACGTYFDVENWHHEILQLLGSAFQGWKNLQDVPKAVTMLGASITDVRNYVNDILKGCG